MVLKMEEKSEASHHVSSLAAASGQGWPVITIWVFLKSPVGLHTGAKAMAVPYTGLERLRDHWIERQASFYNRNSTLLHIYDVNGAYFPIL